MDIAVEGIDKLKVSATPNLQDAIFRAARRLKQPGTDFTVYDIWYLQSKQKYGSSLTQPYIGALGSGSDYTSFLCHYGVPSADMRFTTLEDFSSYPTYHSQSDTFDYVDRILDPGFIFHATLTKIWGGVLIELADSPVVSLNYIPYAYAVYTQLQAVFDLDSWKSLGIESTATAEATSLALAFFNKAKIFHSFGLAVAPTLENALLIRQLNDRLMSVEKLFLLDQGLPGRWYFKHMVYAPASHNTYEGTVFPGLRDSIFERNSQQAKVQLAHIIVALNQVVDLLTT